jgi:hypothetical protein
MKWFILVIMITQPDGTVTPYDKSFIAQNEWICLRRAAEWNARASDTHSQAYCTRLVNPPPELTDPRH